MMKRRLLAVGAAAMMLGACGILDDDGAETGTASLDESEPYVLVDGEVRHILRTECHEITGIHGLNRVMSHLETEDGSLNERIRIEAWNDSDGVQTWDSANVIFDGIGGWEDNNSDNVMVSEAGAAGSTVFDNTALSNMDVMPYGDEVEVEYNLVCTEWVDPEEAREAD